MRDSTFANDDKPQTNGAWQADESWQSDPRFRSEQQEPKAEPFTIKATPFAWTDPRTFPRRRWLYGRHLIRKYISCTVAPAGIGKSSLLLVEAIALATGRNLLGKQVHEGAVRVWVINLEDPLEELQRRVLAILLHYEIDPSELDGRLFLDSGRTAKVVLARTTRNGTEIAEPVVEALRSEIKARAVDVLIVDPMVKAHQVSENDNMAIDMVCSAFAGIADETGCAVDLVHHVKKGTGAEITVEDGRGASALLGAVRSARVLNPMSKDEAEKVGNINVRDFFRDTNGKANLAPPSDKSDWYRKVSVSLGNAYGSDDPFAITDQSDHVAVVEPWEWPDHTATVTVTHLRETQKIAAAGEWRDNIQSPQWIGHAVAQAMKLDAKNPADKQVIKSALGMWFATGMFVKVARKDKNHEMKTFVEVGEPATD